MNIENIIIFNLFYNCNKYPLHFASPSLLACENTFDFPRFMFLLYACFAFYNEPGPSNSWISKIFWARSFFRMMFQQLVCHLLQECHVALQNDSVLCCWVPVFIHLNSSCRLVATASEGSPTTFFLWRVMREKSLLIKPPAAAASEMVYGLKEARFIWIALHF